ncbi:MAG TPA: YkgJ family cysteine cluster protein [Candidatus Omnitrophota bacterium]|nr:YkgJ family cysteine cluster protein [Candidatus Omnitrophota bacterium]
MICDADVLTALRFLPLRKRKEIETLLNIYKEVDQKLDKFKQRSDLHCLSGCGQCCRKACVSCSVLEMQPLAAFLWIKGGLVPWLDRINMNDEQATCVFYSQDSLDNSWHCQIYPFRPLICRLFGFCSRENKARKNELMLCWRIKEGLEQDPPEKARHVFAQGAHAPVYYNYFMKTYAVSPDLADQSMNINLAFAKAAQLIGYYGELTGFLPMKGGE